MAFDNSRLSNPHSFVLVFHLIHPAILWAFLPIDSKILCGNGKTNHNFGPPICQIFCGNRSPFTTYSQKGHSFCPRPRHCVQKHLQVSCYGCNALCHNLRKKKERKIAVIKRKRIQEEEVGTPTKVPIQLYKHHSTRKNLTYEN